MRISGIITSVEFGKEENNSLKVIVKSVSERIDVATAKLLLGDNASVTDILDMVQNSGGVKFANAWISKKLLAYKIHGDSSANITALNLIGLEFFAEHHAINDTLSDGTVVRDANKLINNDTVVVAKVV